MYTRMEGVSQSGTFAETSSNVIASNVMSDTMDMECEDSNRAQKRKNRPQESDSQTENEEEIMRPPKLRPKSRRVLPDNGQDDDTQMSSSRMAQEMSGNCSVLCV